ncbi:MAG TPA: FtsX-like permease family protein [Longimicrobiales bacterium]|nr:FtsX-like permease family protein [Longimicrobiales bacterium]
MALGAGNARIVKSVLGQSLVAGVLGLVAGLGGAWAWGRLLDAFLYRTSPRDPAAFAAGAALLLGVVLLASWLPARRATRVDPVEALKAE